MHDIVYEFRPEEVLGEHAYQPQLRYNNGLWTKDDGEFDLAFISDPDYKKGLTFNIYFTLPHFENLEWMWMKYQFNPLHTGTSIHNDRWHTMLKEGCTHEGKARTPDPSDWQELTEDDLLKYHPNQIAHHSACRKLREHGGGWNGRSVSLNVYDSTIKYGLLRNAETHEIIKPPKILNCIYCGEIHFDHDTWDEVVPEINHKAVSEKADFIRKEMDELYNLVNPTGRIIEEEDWKKFANISEFLIKMT